MSDQNVIVQRWSESARRFTDYAVTTYAHALGFVADQARRAPGRCRAVDLCTGAVVLDPLGRPAG